MQTFNLFTYGSLMIEEVMQAVTGYRFPGEEAVLKGYARYTVRGASYPGIVPLVGSETQGLLYTGVDRASLARLDRFEGVVYVRMRVEVRVGAVQRTAQAYVVGAAYRGMLSEEGWSLVVFRERHLADFLRSYHGFSA